MNTTLRAIHLYY